MRKKKENNNFGAIVSWIIILTLLLAAIILGIDYYRPESSLLKRPESSFILKKGVSFFKKKDLPKESSKDTDQILREIIKKPSLVSPVEEPLKPPKDTDQISKEIIKKPSLVPPAGARVAIIIDDLGQSFGEKEKALLNLGYPLTLSVLPGLPYSKRMAQKAHQKGLEVMLHLPMEPHGYPAPGKNPGQSAIFTNMSDLEIARLTREAIEGIPYLSGVNNHMGSKAMEDKRVMSVVLDEIEKNNLFFVDSGTSQNSVAHRLAVKKGLKTGERQVFLDNKDDKEYIKGQLKLLAKKAKKDGYAIAVGHVHRKWTSVALAEMLPLMEKEGIKVVSVSEIVD